MVCALDELRHTPNKIKYAPAELRAMMVQYQQSKGQFPGALWSFLLTFVALPAAIGGLAQLKRSSEIAEPIFYAGLAASTAVAVFA